MYTNMVLGDSNSVLFNQGALISGCPVKRGSTIYTVPTERHP